MKGGKPEKRYSIEVDKETYDLFTLGAKKLGMIRKAYMKLCAIQCKSDVKAK